MAAVDHALDSARSRLGRLRRVLRRTLLRRRRLLAAALTGLAVLAGLRATAPPPAPTRPVWVAARDLPAGVRLAPEDLRRVTVPAGLVPDGVATSAQGRVLASALRRGEPVTDARLWGAGLAAGYPGRVVLPVRFPDADAALLLHPGDRIDVTATDPRGRSAAIVAAGAVVVLVPPQATSTLSSGSSGRLVVLAVAPQDAIDLGASQARVFLSYAVSL